jgi:abortive infection bacteriophage resistance protein
LYRLDEALRKRVFSAISPIEIFLRVRIIEGLSRRWGSFAHYLPELFRTDFNQTEWASGVEKEITRAREPFIEHFRRTYSGFPKLPIWMGVEVMSLGTISQLFNGLLPEPRRIVADGLAVPHPVLRSWLHFLSYIRNVCAHHARLWDRELAIRPDIPRKSPAWQGLATAGAFAFSIVPVLEMLYRWARLPEGAVDSIRRVFVEISELDPRFKRMCGAPADWHGAHVLPAEER